MMRLVFVPALACCVFACARDGAEQDDAAWARFATTGRHITAPVTVEIDGTGDTVVGITTRGAGALVDEHGAVVAALAGSEDRSATCVLARFEEHGALVWQTPVRAEDAQTRCASLQMRDDGAIIARGETFDVDEDTVRLHAGDARATLDDDERWLVSVTRDGRVDIEALDLDLDAELESFDRDAELDAALRMDTCTPALSALAAAFDDVRQSVRNGSGYFDLRGATQHIGAALVPQGADLDTLVPGASAPAVDESAVESVATIVRTSRAE